MENLTIIVLAILIVMSVVTYFAYAIDKRKATNGKWRTKEKTLLSLSFFGGALGGLMAMYGIRHKNRKLQFVIVNFGSLVLHLVLLFITTII